jgi:hypothetical protein
VALRLQLKRLEAQRNHARQVVGAHRTLRASVTSGKRCVRQPSSAQPRAQDTHLVRDTRKCVRCARN